MERNSLGFLIGLTQFFILDLNEETDLLELERMASQLHQFENSGSRTTMPDGQHELT